MTDERLNRLVAKRVQELRTAKGLTQEDMQDFGFNYRYYQRIEAGEKNLSLKLINRLAAMNAFFWTELYRTMHVREKIELMIGFAMELAAWMFVGAVGIVILVFVISVGLGIVCAIIRCIELLHDAPRRKTIRVTCTK